MVSNNNIIYILYMYNNYVINLERRKDRYDDFLKKCKKNNIKNIIRFNAFDKNNLKNKNGKIISDVIYTKYQTNIFKNFRNLQFGEIGCFLSHICLWEKQLLNNNEYIIIYEDDPIFCNNYENKFNNIINKIDKIDTILYLGGRFKANFRMKRCINVCDNIVKYDYNKEWNSSDCDRGTYSYIINKNCSKLLLENLNNPKFFNIPIDHYMMNVLKKYKKDIYHVNPLIIYSIVNSPDSDIR